MLFDCLDTDGGYILMMSANLTKVVLSNGVTDLNKGNDGKHTICRFICGVWICFNLRCSDDDQCFGKEIRLRTVADHSEEGSAGSYHVDNPGRYSWFEIQGTKPQYED